MNGPNAAHVAVQRRRLMIMVAIDAVCVLVAIASVIGALSFHQGWMMGLFVGAVLAGFGAQLWLVVGLILNKAEPDRAS